MIDTPQKIRVLTSFRNQIDLIENSSDGRIWVIKVTDTVKAYLGKDSYLFKAIEEFYFAQSNMTPNDTVPQIINGLRFYTHFNKNNEKEKAKKLIDACIETIRNFTPNDNPPTNKETVVATMKILDEVLSKMPEQPTHEEIIGELVLQILHLQARVNIWDLEFDETIAEDDPELAEAVRKSVDERTITEFYRLCENQNDISEYLNHVLQQFLKKRLE